MGTLESSPRYSIKKSNPLGFKASFIDLIISKGPMNCSQKDTAIWIAKTQGPGGSAKKTRSLYISRPAANVLFFGEYPAKARKGREIFRDMIRK